jgi:hypothetical protein
MSPRRTSALTFQYHLSLSVPGQLDTRLVGVLTNKSESLDQQGSIFLGKLPGYSLLHKGSSAAASALAGQLNALVKLRLETECESMLSFHGVTSWFQNLHAQ